MSYNREIFIVIDYLEPGYVPKPGEINSFYISPEAIQQFEYFISNLVTNEKTDGIQYSKQLGQSIRKFLTDEDAMLYYEYAVEHFLIAYNVPMDKVSYVIREVL